jgi:hypothetical protein
MSQTDPDLPPDLLEVARALDADGPRMTETEFARVRRTALGRTTSARPRAAGPFTRSRVAITSMLAVGALMSTGGAALGVSALSTDLSARAAQYGTTTQQASPQTLAPPVSGNTSPGNSSGVAGASQTAVQAPTPAQDVNQQNGAEQTTEGQSVAAAAAQAPRQLEAPGRSELPFTGYAAIPLLLMGLALLTAGCLLRRGGRGAANQA